MRRVLAFILFSATAATALSQNRVDPAWSGVFKYAADAAQRSSGASVAESVKPDVIVTVRHHQLGVDVVELTAIEPKYPKEVLKAQAERLARLLGREPSQLRVESYQIGADPKMVFTKATFATIGLIDREKGVLHLTPILRAFAKTPAPHTVDGLTVIFDGERPGPSTLRDYADENVRVEATASEAPLSVEYRVQLLSQDPARLTVPDTVQPEPKPAPAPSTPKRSGVEWITWISLIAAAAAASILVYFLLVRSTGKRGR